MTNLYKEILSLHSSQIIEVTILVGIAVLIIIAIIILSIIKKLKDK